MRNHGWELPYHPLQTVAVAVFSGLSFSFYVFFIPFVGSGVLKFHIYAAFSPVVITVFILYVRCAGCDPADPGVHHARRAARVKQRAALKVKDSSLSDTDTRLQHMQVESAKKAAQNLEASELGSSSTCARWLCLPFACCKWNDSGKLNTGEQLLYCSICEAEISKNSKHCRACDKCVHEFDHHCRWLNNCVGKRNYRTFVSLMVACLFLLLIVWSTGIIVLVRCFSQKANFEKEILHRLGSSFSRVSYIIVVVLLSLLAMLGTIPLCQLFFFHLILIHKGITTYDYILAVREQGVEHDTAEGDAFNSLTSSPASSNATGVSGYSSAGAVGLHRGVFCTPPRMFVEHQQRVLALGGDLESNSPAKVAKKDIRAAKAQPSQKKISVGINPWKLARLNAEEAVKAAAQAREASTNIIRPTTRGSKGSSQITETEANSSLESSRTVSGEITVVGNKWNHHRRKHHDLPYLTGKERWLLMKDRRGKSIIPNTKPEHVLLTSNGSPKSMVRPLPLEARNGLRYSPSRFSGEMRASCPGSSYPGSSYPGSQLASPEMVFRESPELQTVVPPSSSTLLIDAAPVVQEPPSENENINILIPKSYIGTNGYEASPGDSGDEKIVTQGLLNLQGLIQTLTKSTLDTSIVTPNEKVAVWEDGSQEKPRSSSGSRSLCSRGSRSSRGESTGGRTESSSGSRAEANILKHIRKERPELGDRLSASPDGSAGSFPSPFTSPLDSLKATRSSSKAKIGRTSTSSTGVSPAPTDGVPVVTPTKRLKESLIMGKTSISTKLADVVIN